eukprot:16439282-Heterocapsa_arctica.AAC.1
MEKLGRKLTGSQEERYIQMDQINGGSAQMRDRMKLAEETWGDLWAVDAEDLPKFSKQHLPLITEDE